MNPTHAPAATPANPRFRPFVTGALLYAFLVTLLRALRTPNDFAMAHWLVSYRFGLIKRGLPGTLMHPFLSTPFGHAHAQAVLVVVAFAILIAYSLGLLRLTRAILHNGAWTRETVLLGGALLTSPLVVMAGHVTGYFDQIFYLLTWIAAHLALSRRNLAAALLLTVGLLVHESTAVIGVPVVVFTCLLEVLGRSPGPGTPTRPWPVEFAKAAWPYALTVLVFAGVAAHQRSLPRPEFLRAALEREIESYGFVGHGRSIYVPESLTTTFGDYASSQGPRFVTRITRPRYVATMLPALALALLFVRRRLRGTRGGLPLLLLATLLSLLPLGLLAIALDAARIWTYSLGVVSVVVWVVFRSRPPAAAELSGSLAVRAFAAAVVILNGVGTIELMDFVSENFTTPVRLALYAPVFAAALAAAFAPAARSRTS